MRKGNFIDVITALVSNKECWYALADIANVALVQGCGKKDTSSTLHDIVDSGFTLGETVIDEVKKLS
jgi:hypothetical protein